MTGGPELSEANAVPSSDTTMRQCGALGVYVDTFAKHLIVELRGCDSQRLNDPEALQRLMRRGADAAGARVIAEVYHPYSPHGVTGVLLLQESHFSVHTWPECGYAALDFYSCGSCAPEKAVEVLREGLCARQVEIMTIHRGREGQAHSLGVDPALLARTDLAP